MSRIEIKDIDESFNEEMLQILSASPINAGGLSLYFDKQPGMFAQPKMKFFLSKHVGLFINGKLKGFGSIGYYNALVNGNKEQVFYLHNFYVLPEARGHNFLYNGGLELLLNNPSKDTVGFSITMKGNKPAEHHFNYPAVKSILKVKPIESLIVKNIILSFPKKNTTEYKIRTATVEDIPVIVGLLQNEFCNRLFGNDVTLENFIDTINKRKGLTLGDYYVATTHSGEIVGVCAAWDCSSFRQTRVLQYSKKFWPDLIGYNLLSSFLPMAAFPKNGEYFKEITLLDYGVKDRCPVIMHALLCGIYNNYINKNYHYINWASCGSDPLLQAAKGFWHRSTESTFVLIANQSRGMDEKALKLPYVEIPFL